MERLEAIARLTKLKYTDLVALAGQYEVTIWKGDKKNKGWAGHTLERYLGLPINSAQSPNFGSWELKVVPLKILKNGRIAVKETMAITMIDPHNVARTPFAESHLLAKLQKAVICARLFESVRENRSILLQISAFDLSEATVYQQVKNDYETIRECILSNGFDCLESKMGVLVQARTKGAGHGSRSRAFYARTRFVTEMLRLNEDEISTEFVRNIIAPQSGE